MQSKSTELLTRMRGKEAMYIGDQSVVKLAHFLRGYSQALIDMGVATKFDEFLYRIQTYTQCVNEMLISRSWENILEFVCSPSEAMKTFWTYYDEIVSDRDLIFIEEFLRGNEEFRAIMR